MARTGYTIGAAPEQVFAVLADGWTYSDWVVGTVHIRDVDPTWPAPGSKLYHKAGPWPLSLHDTSTVLECDPPSRLVLRVQLWPFGEGVVAITLTPGPEGRTRVTLVEEFSAGPLRWVWTKLNDLVLHRRNVESLRRLADIVERGEADRPMAG